MFSAKSRKQKQKRKRGWVHSADWAHSEHALQPVQKVFQLARTLSEAYGLLNLHRRKYTDAKIQLKRKPKKTRTIVFISANVEISRLGIVILVRKHLFIGICIYVQSKVHGGTYDSYSFSLP